MSTPRAQSALEGFNLRCESETSSKTITNKAHLNQLSNKQNDSLSVMLSVYVKNPSALIEEKRKLKEEAFDKQRRRIDPATHSVKRVKKIEDLDVKLSVLKKLKQQKINTLALESSKYKEKLFLAKEETQIIKEQTQIIKEQTQVIKEQDINEKNETRIDGIDYSKRNQDYLKALQEKQEKKKQVEEEKKREQEKIRQEMSASLKKGQNRLFEATELSKLRSEALEQEKAKKSTKDLQGVLEALKQQQVKDKAEINQEMKDRQQKYLEKLKMQMEQDKKMELEKLKKDGENKIRIRNAVLSSIHKELDEDRRRTLDHYNLYLSKNTEKLSSTSKLCSLPEIGAPIKNSENTEVETLENRPISQNESVIKKLRAIPFITNIKEWKKKQRIPEDSKIFIITGGYKDFKKALLRRGWIENPQADSRVFDLKWTLLVKEIDFDNLLPSQIVNHFEKNNAISSKIGLLNSLKSLTWFDNAHYLSFFPECYDMNDPDEFNQLVKSFKLYKAESVLKKYVRLAGENDPKAQEIKLQAQMSFSVLVKYCKNVDDIIDEKDCSYYYKDVSEEDWEIINSDEMKNDEVSQKKYEAWLKKIKLAFQGIKTTEIPKKKKKKKPDTVAKNPQSSAKRESPETEEGGEVENEQDEGDNKEEDNEDGQFLQDAKKFLKEKSLVDPQFYMKGEDNIWIVKPAGLSRGRGITCYNNLAEIIDHAKSMELQMIVQKYIENPVLIKQKKFDIRIWILVTDWNPLGVWYFDDCYVRFSADDYSTNDLSNKFQHLTNNAITKKKKDAKVDEEDIISSQGNMFSQQQLEQFLLEEAGTNVFQEKIKPKIMEIVKWTMLSCQDVIEPRKNSMELFGYDVMLDTNYNPWLLEVNTSPSLEYSTPITERLVKRVLEDVVKVVVDYGFAMKSGAKQEDLDQINTGSFIKVCQNKEISDQGISSLCTNLLCEGKQMKILRPKKIKKRMSKNLNQNTQSNLNDQE